MRRITVLCVGKLKEKFYREAAAEYSKRLSRYCTLELLELPEAKLPANPSAAQIDAALEKEAAAVRAKLPPRALVIALCIEGRLCSSEEMAGILRRGAAQDAPPRICFLIGGSYGLDARLKAEASDRLSMSPMTFPHHLARVMLLEQIYRGFQILEGGRYHK